jgi:hypothetical protein
MRPQEFTVLHIVLKVEKKSLVVVWNLHNCKISCNLIQNTSLLCNDQNVKPVQVFDILTNLKYKLIQA